MGDPDAPAAPGMTAVLLPPPDYDANDALDALDDVMAFINALDASPDADDAGDECSSLLRFLDAPIPIAAAAAPEPRAASSDDGVALASRPTAAASASEAAPEAAPVKEATRKRNAHREKMKREMQFLRLRATEMEQQLAALRQGTAAALSSTDRQLIEASWQRIALHQLEARRESEAENVRLKSVLQTHVEMSKSLGQTLGKRVDAAFLSGDGHPKVKRGRTALCDGDEDFAALFGSLDAAFERLDEVMESSGLTDVSDTRGQTFETKTDVSASGVVTPYIEMADTSVAPFPTRLVAKAAWKAIVREFFQRSSEGGGSDKQLWYTGNTIALKARNKYKLKSRDGEEQFLNSKLVFRKYIDEESRLVLVWRAFNEIDGGLDVYSDETGWSVAQAIAGLSESGSIVRRCVHFVQRHRATASALDFAAQQEDPAVGMLTDLALTSSEADMAEMLRATENLLLDEAAAPSGER